MQFLNRLYLPHQIKIFFNSWTPLQVLMLLLIIIHLRLTFLFLTSSNKVILLINLLLRIFLLTIKLFMHLNWVIHQISVTPYTFLPHDFLLLLSFLTRPNYGLQFYFTVLLRFLVVCDITTALKLDQTGLFIVNVVQLNVNWAQMDGKTGNLTVFLLIIGGSSQVSWVGYTIFSVGQRYRSHQVVVFGLLLDCWKS